MTELLGLILFALRNEILETSLISRRPVQLLIAKPWENPLNSFKPCLVINNYTIIIL